MRARTVGAIIAGLAASVMTVPVAAAETFTVVSGLPAAHPAARIFRKYFHDIARQQMAAASEGMSVKWRPAYDGTIAKYGDVLEAVADGVADIGIVAVDNETRRLPLQDISFHLPFSTTECTLAGGAYHALHKRFTDMNTPWQQAGQIYLANITTDGYGLFTGPRVKSVEDLRGLTLAVAVRIESWLSGVAATPLRLPLGQIAGNFDAEAIGGAILPITELAELGLQRQLNNYLLTEFGPQTAYAVTVNAHRFTDLPAPLREALLAAADQFVPAAAEAYCDAGEQALEAATRQGVRTQRFFRSRREQWVAALPPLGRQWADAREAQGFAGSDIVSAYMDHLRAAGARPKRDWDRDLAPAEALIR